MTSIERVLDERANDLAEALRDVGFSDAEAARFVEAAGPALVRSCEWHTAAVGRTPITREDTREVLGGMPGRALAHATGLPERKAWDGLRQFVPAVLDASGRIAGSGPGRAARPEGGSVPDVVARFDVGFGLTLDWLSMRKPPVHDAEDGEPQKTSGVSHPIFSRLLSLRD